MSLIKNNKLVIVLIIVILVLTSLLLLTNKREKVVTAVDGVEESHNPIGADPELYDKFTSIYYTITAAYLDERELTEDEETKVSENFRYAWDLFQENENLYLIEEDLYTKLLLMDLSFNSYNKNNATPKDELKNDFQEARMDARKAMGIE
ncbi:hypothetical protein [Sporosarcina jiandibaonis]|uniref:hypothetical protein n=1 Tax=Sporosarcina jiandibaonis TaxID=2715535 RepID=UPI001554776D|nr:hypothetical protein [Sporosarcina jiandibaonis]